MVRVLCETGAHYTRGTSKLASGVALLFDFERNLVWLV